MTDVSFDASAIGLVHVCLFSRLFTFQRANQAI